ncbi:hypothetical protein [Vibrio diabolicus]|uniref:hypothetical protein n=1 Tax=Vibrio diabolicus TaxID=50719 RepID=UPI002940002F|nr:hypothetical protein [Vibrio diabolicus]EHZ2539440.1 hypothetical protein [Vibrio parahaemolyticus]MDV5036865.1 hypothetical protein [Vibrio diabolicus]
MTEKLISFDLENDTIMSLQCLLDALSQIESGNSSYFKWAVVYGHNSAQSVMCLALITSDSHLVRKKNSCHSEYGDLDNIEWLYEKLRIKDFLPYMDSQVIDSQRFEKVKMSRLQAVRNSFIHQQPSSYVFTFNELLELIRISVDLVGFLINESGRLALNDHTESQIKDLVDKLRTQLTRYNGVNS